MPFVSDAQRRFMYAKHPRIAKRWEAHTPKGKDLPERVKKALARLKLANGNGEEDEPTITPGKPVPAEAVSTFFRHNPAPEDAQVHELADAYGTDPHTLEEQVYQLVGNKMKTGADKVPGGIADKKTNTDFNAHQIAMGRKVELEHTDSPTIAEEIARDHLEEFPNYYTALDEMENKLKSQKKEQAKVAYTLGSLTALQTLNLTHGG
jgi:hypothetical protein